MAPHLDQLGSRARGPRVEIHLRRLRTARERKGWTQQDLAIAAGMTVSTINRLENGRQTPNLSTALVLAIVLGCPIERLLALEPEEIRALRAGDVTASTTVSPALRRRTKGGRK